MDDLLYKKMMESGNDDEKAQCRIYLKEEKEMQEAKFFNKTRIVLFIILFVVGIMSGEINPSIASILIFFFMAYEFAYYTKAKDNIFIKSTMESENINSDNIREDYCYFRNY